MEHEAEEANIKEVRELADQWVKEFTDTSNQSNEDEKETKENTNMAAVAEEILQSVNSQVETDDKWRQSAFISYLNSLKQQQ